MSFKGMDPYMEARLLGHSDMKMLTKIYDHTSMFFVRKQSEKVKETVSKWFLLSNIQIESQIVLMRRRNDRLR